MAHKSWFILVVFCVSLLLFDPFSVMTGHILVVTWPNFVENINFDTLKLKIFRVIKYISDKWLKWSST